MFSDGTVFLTRVGDLLRTQESEHIIEGQRTREKSDNQRMGPFVIDRSVWCGLNLKAVFWTECQTGRNESVSSCWAQHEQLRMKQQAPSLGEILINLARYRLPIKLFN